MGNLKQSYLDGRNCDNSCEYCSNDYQHHRYRDQYLQEFQEVNIKKDR